MRVVQATNPWVEDGTSGAENTRAAVGGAKDISRPSAPAPADTVARSWQVIAFFTEGGYH